MRDAPPSLAARRSDVPPALAALVMRCLEKDPARRPASANELLESFDAVSMPVAAVAPSAYTRRRWPLAAVLVVTAGSAWLIGRPRCVAATTSTTPAASAKSLAVLRKFNLDVARFTAADGGRSR